MMDITAILTDILARMTCVMTHAQNKTRTYGHARTYGRMYGNNERKSRGYNREVYYDRRMKLLFLLLSLDLKGGCVRPFSAAFLFFLEMKMKNG